MKKWNPDICNNTDGTWGHYAKWKVRQRKENTVSFHIYMELEKKEFIETENIFVVARGRGWRVEELDEDEQSTNFQYKLSKFENVIHNNVLTVKILCCMFESC